MSTVDIDFEGDGYQGQPSTPPANPTNSDNNNALQDEVTNLNGGDADDVTGKDNTTQNENNNNNEEVVEDSVTGELQPGDTIDVDGTIYTVSNNGDIVDNDGNVFKKANEVAEWMKSVEMEDDNDGLSLSNIQEKIGVTITDENGTPIEFSNDADGVQSYIDAVLEVKSNELQEAAVNRLFAENPYLRDFDNYVRLTGSPAGFNQIPDRRGIIVDKDDEAQQVAIIRMAAREFGNKSLNENYIKYLHDSGSLYDEARNQLAALQERDVQVRQRIEQEAKEKEEEESLAVRNFFNKAYNVIKGRTIGDFKLPESFTKEIDGKKVVCTPEDFFDYISNNRYTNSDGETCTGYMRDLQSLSEDEYLNREIIDAWLLYTGGTYRDLIDMAVKEEKVRQLRVKSREQRSSKSVKVIKTPKGKASIDDIIF